ncbi:hypothetical protein AVEN_249931-1 [Araneus ventricosus]|uniref:Uncharacterized protein n=1 Tax=Araneus ventricosus TaxID=182803 RepID=A0A4Y2DZN9_ARAVE|nr:hypothetical protein AVEN_249931-1 [Araneus ventricosus]
MYACIFECLALSLPNANFKGNFYRLNLNGKSFGIIGMHEIKTLSFLNIRRLDLGVQFVTMRSLRKSRLRISSTGTPTFNLSLWEGTPDNSKDLEELVICYIKKLMLLVIAH